MCMCVCVREREKERKIESHREREREREGGREAEREREREREGERERDRESVCVRESGHLRLRFGVCHHSIYFRLLGFDCVQCQAQTWKTRRRGTALHSQGHASNLAQISGDNVTTHC